MLNYGLLLEITHILSLLIVAVGIVGNILLFIIYWRGSLRQLSISIYFRSIALVNLFITLNMLKVFFRDRYSLNVGNYSPLACKITYYTIYFAGPVSSWTLVAISIDRLLTLAWPMRFSFLNQTRFQISVIATVYIYNMVYYAHLLVDAKILMINNQTSQCDITNDQLLYWLDLVNSSLLPFASMMITSVLTIIFILRSRRKFTSTSRACTFTITSRRMRRDRKFATTSVSLNVLFLILNVPAPVFGVISSNLINQLDVQLHNFIGYFSLCCYYSYYAISFYVQLAVNSIVRDTFFRLLNKKKSKSSFGIKNNSNFTFVTIPKLKSLRHNS